MSSFGERYKRWQEQQQGGSFADRYARWRAEKYGAEYAENIQGKVQSWMDEHNAFVQSYTDRFGNRPDSPTYVSDSSDWYSAASATSGQLNAAADEILKDLDRNGYIYGDEYVQAVRDMITSGRGAYTGILDTAQKDADYWKQFNPTEEQVKSGIKAETIYNKWLDEQKYRDKYAGMSYDEVQREAVTVDSEEEAEWLRSYLPTLWTGEMQKITEKRVYKDLSGLQYDLGNLTNKEIKEKYGSKSNLQSLIAEEQTQVNQFDQRNAWSLAGNMINPSSYAYAEDFSQYSRYTPSGTITVKDGKVTDDAGADSTYEYINNKNGFRSYYNDWWHRNTEPALGDDGRSNMEKAGYDHMLEQEIATYNYLYAKNGKAAADKYLENLEPMLQARSDGEAAAYMKDFATNYPVLASAYSVGTSLNSGFEYLGQVAGYLTDKVLGNPAEIGGNRNSLITSTIRGTVSDNYKWAIGNWDVFDFLYGTTMSGIDSVAGGALFGKLGGTVLGLSAAAQGTEDALNRGLNKEQALWNGIWAGVFEGLFETFSLEKTKTFAQTPISTLRGSAKDIAYNIAKSMLTNASEEAFTEIANIVYDTFVNGELANYTLEEIRNGAGWDIAGQVLESAASGALMGFGMTGGSYTGRIAHNLSSATRTGKYISGAMGGVDALKGLADTQVHGDMDVDAKLRIQDLAGKVAVGPAGGKGLGKFVAGMKNNYHTGQLHNAVRESYAEQNRADLVSSLVKNGYGKDTAGDLADALLAENADVDLTKEQKKLLQKEGNTEAVKAAVAEVIDNPDSGMNQRAKAMAEYMTGLNARYADKAVKETLEDVSVSEEAPASELTKLAREAVDARYDAENGAGLDGISAEGRAIYRDQAVDVVDIDKAGGGKVTVKLADGRSVDATALEYEDSGEAELWRVIGEYAQNADSARALLEEYQKGNLDAYKYARGVEEAFLYGKLNLSPKEMEIKGSMVNDLSAAQRNVAYTQGKRAGENKKQQAEQQQEHVDTVYKQAKTALEQNGTDVSEHSVQLADGLTAEKMGKTQRASYEFAEMIAPAVKADIRIYNGGKEWGYYDHKTDTICLNINAKWDGVSMISFTMAHELVHRSALGSPVKYQAFADFLVQQYGEQGASVNYMVQEQLQAAEENGISMTYEEAFEEVICDACQKMLVDTDAGKKLAEFGAKSTQNKNTVQQFGQWLKELVQKLRRIFRNVEPDSLAAQEFQRFDDNVKQILADMFVDMSMDAGEKLSTIKAAGMTEKITTDEGGVKFCSRSNVPTEFNPKGLSLEEQLKEILDTAQSFDGRYLYIGKFTTGFTKEVSKHVEIKDYPIVMNYRDAYLSMESKENGRYQGDNINYHNIGPEGMIDAISSFGDPEAVMLSKKNGKIELAIKGIDRKGKPLLAIVEINTSAQNAKKFMRAHVTTSIYGKRNMENYINKAEAADRLIYKKQEEPAQGIPQVQYKGDINANSSKASIRNSNPNVNKNSEGTEKGPFKLPASKDAADRGMLVDLFEQMVTGSDEYRALQNYKKNINQMLALEEKVDRLTEEIKRVSFGEGPRNMEYLDNLKAQRKQAVAELNRFDNILLGLEKSGVLRSMIERNQQMIQQETRDKTREYYRQKNETREAEIRQYYRESRRQAVERHDKAQVRQQIRKDVQRLDSLLNKGTKEKNVKLELQEFAGAALRTAKGTFLKNYNEYDMVRNGVNATMSREQKVVFARAQALLKELDKIWEERNSEPGPNSIHEKWDPEENLRRDDHEEALKKELAKNMAVLREAGIFRVENELMEDSIADQLMDELMAAYSALKDSESTHVREVFSTAIYSHMEGVKKFLAGKAVKDMTTIELGKLKDMYRMVLHTITTSNDLFAQKRKADVRMLGEEVIGQLRTPGKEMTAEILDTLKKMGWANLKPETALELIGSDTLTEMMQGLYRGEDTYARDLEQARQYAQELGDKYGRNKWDMKKSVSFAGTKITLGQAMSLYAYTKRKQAQGHLEGEGFTHSSNVRIEGVLGKLPIKLSYIMNATRTHIVPKGAYADVAALLTPEQRKYVDAMQEYLSKVMGAKGNEVSMQMYGVKLFEETMYFPLKTASEYREEALGATAGEVKLRNTGFTQKTVDGASNPIVLDDFESVWAGHVDKMSLYHGFVLPMEDFDRVYNYRHAVEEGVTDAEGEVYKTKLVDTNESVKVDVENKMGKAANEYIENFMKQLNGGVRGDSTEKLFASMVRNFKKTAVLGSLSVSVQQPTAFIRAMAYLDPRDVGNPKDFLGKAGKPERKILEEMYKYAPVALMKHIGGFDPGLGRTTKAYVFEDKKSVTGALDNFLGMFPEKMDEWTWSYIWVCTKRQIHRQNPDLKINSKEFLEKVGERFSKIIRDTQVYDSVLTKSQIMRSKNVFLQMATAFMNEPTTSMDMYIRSTLQAKRGKIKKSQAARTYAAVVSSQILTAAVVAFVYALRDDDEDETYWEKYLSAAIGKAWENTMPWYSIPFVKDVFSIFDGYSVERSDMSLITDLYQGWQKLQSGSATAWEKTEAFAGSILNMFGIPLKNVSRDVRSIFNTVKTWFNGGVEKTGAGLRYAVLEGLTGKEVTKAVQLQNAVAENDVKHILRVLATYSSDSSAFTAFRSAVKAAYLQGDVTEEQAAEFLQAYAGDDVAETRKKIAVWKFQGRHPESKLADGKILDYAEFAEPARISLEIYTRYAEETAGLESEKDEDGKPVSGSKRKKVLAVIDSLPLTSTQKDALYFAEGYAESTLDEAPWH